MTGPGTLLVCLASVVTAAWAPPPPPPPPPTPEEAFELGFNAGQAQYEAGAFLEAARTWVEAARRTPEVTANRENRAALFDYIADSYLRGLPVTGRGAVLREAIAVLDGYCDGFLRAYGAEAPISAKILQIQAELRRQLGAQPGDTIEPSWTSTSPTPEVRPWKGLLVGGSVLAGVGAGAALLAGVTGARGNSVETEFEAARCSLYTPTLSCAELIGRGRAANALAITGAVVAPLALGGGVAMLIVGARRKAARHALVPVLTPTLVGLTFRWVGRFRKAPRARDVDNTNAHRHHGSYGISSEHPEGTPRPPRRATASGPRADPSPAGRDDDVRGSPTVPVQPHR